MASVLKVSVLLEAIAKTEGFQKINQEARRCELAMKKLQPTLKAASFAFGALNKGIAEIGKALGSGIAFFAKFGGDAVKLASQIKGLSESSGLSSEEMQVLGYAAETNGAKMEDMAKAAQTVQKNAAEAAMGNADLAAKFSRLGISAGQFSRLKPAEQMERLGRAVATAKNQQEAMAAAMDLVGAQNAPRLMAALKTLGVEGYAGLATQAKRAGQVMSDSMVKDLDKAQIAWDSFFKRVTIWSGRYIQDLVEIHEGWSGLSEKSKELADAEQKYGLKSAQATKAHLDYIRELIKLGKVREAQVELNHTKAPEAEATPQDMMVASSMSDINGPLPANAIRIAAKGMGDQARADSDFQRQRNEIAKLIQAEQERQAAKAKAASKKATDDAAEALRARNELLLNEQKKFNDTLLKRNEDARAAYKKEIEEGITKDQEQQEKIRLASARRYQDELAAIENRGRNDYQSRGLALDAASLQMPTAVPQGLFPVAPTPATHFDLPKSNDAGREDSTQQTQLLKSIDKSMGDMSRVIANWA